MVIFRNICVNQQNCLCDALKFITKTRKHESAKEINS